MQVLYIVAAGLVGIVIGWLIMRLRMSSLQASLREDGVRLEKELAISQERAGTLLSEGQRLAGELDAERRNASELAFKLARLEGDYANLQPVEHVTWTFLPGTEAARLKIINTGHNWGVLEYVKGRLMAAGSGATDGYKIWNITASGNNPAILYTHPNTAFTWVGFAAGQQHIYAAGYAGRTSLIYKTAIKADGTALDIPSQAGELPRPAALLVKAGATAEAVAVTVSGIGALLNVRYDLRSGSKKLNWKEGTNLIS